MVEPLVLERVVPISASSVSGENAALPFAAVTRLSLRDPNRRDLSALWAEGVSKKRTVPVARGHLLIYGRQLLKKPLRSQHHRSRVSLDRGSSTSRVYREPRNYAIDVIIAG